jgi:hypothetical protein
MGLGGKGKKRMLEASFLTTLSFTCYLPLPSIVAHFTRDQYKCFCSSRNFWKRKSQESANQYAYRSKLSTEIQITLHATTGKYNVLLIQHVYRKFVNIGVASATGYNWEPECAVMQTMCRIFIIKQTSHRMEKSFQNSKHWNQHDSFGAVFKITSLKIYWLVFISTIVFWMNTRPITGASPTNSKHKMFLP